MVTNPADKETVAGSKDGQMLEYVPDKLRDDIEVDRRRQGEQCCRELLEVQKRCSRCGLDGCLKAGARAAEWKNDKDVVRPP